MTTCAALLLAVGAHAATVDYNAGTHALTFTATAGTVDDVTVSSPTATQLRILLGNAETFAFSGGAVGNPNFVITTTVTINDTLTINVAGSPVGAFAVSLDDMDDVFTLTSTAFTNYTSLSVDGGAGNDTFNIPPSTTVPISIVGGTDTHTNTVVTISAGGATINISVVPTQQSGDVLNLQDQSFSSAATYTLDRTSTTVGTVRRTSPAGPGLITFATVENINLNAGSGANTFAVNNTVNTVNTILNCNGNGNTVNVTTTGSAGHIIVNGGTGPNTYTVSNVLGSIMDINGSAAGDTLNLTMTTMTSGFRFNGGAGADTINVRSMVNFDIAVLNGGGGNDTFNLGTAGNSMANLAGFVQIDGQSNDSTTTTASAGTAVTSSVVVGDTVNFNDQGDTGDTTYTFTATKLTRTGITNGVNFFNLETLVLNTSSGTDIVTLSAAPSSVDHLILRGNSTALTSDTFNLTASASGIATEVSGGAGSDVFNVTPLSGLGVSIVGGGPTTGAGDTLSYSDLSATNRTYTITNASVAASSVQSLAYSGIETLSVAGGSGNDTFNVDSVAAGTATSVDGGTGTNTLRFSNFGSGVAVNLGAGTSTGLSSVANFSRLEGSPFNDTLTGTTGNTTFTASAGTDTITGVGTGNKLIGANTTNTWTINGTDGGTLVSGPSTTTFTAIQNLTGGTQGDTFQYTAAGSVAGTVDGGSGTDQLDNTALTGATVAIAGTGTVDGSKGTATGTGGFDNIELLPLPTVASINPTTGPTTGGTAVTLTGTNFTGATAVTFGATAATFTFNSATSITATAPAGAAGAVDITVTTPNGTSPTSASDQFTYVVPAPTLSAVTPTTGTTAGGTVVTLTGANFTGATAVKFGTTAATTFTFNSATSITATAPSASAGTVDVTVTTPGGTSATTAADQFTFVVPVPTVSAVSPASGPIAGGTVVTLTGTDFTGATAVTFGATPGTSVTVNGPTSITVTSPAHAVATVNVTVTTPGGTSTTGAANEFRFLQPGTLEILSAKDPAASNYATSHTGDAAASVNPALSGDGRYVAFLSSASDLVAGQSATGGFQTGNVYLRDRTGNTTKLISQINDGTANAGHTAGNCSVVSISADGRYVAFASTATNLLPTPTAGSQVFLYDRDGNSGAGSVTLVSHTALSLTAGSGGAGSGSPLISRDGSAIVFAGAGTDLVAGFTPGTGNALYRYDRASGTITLASPKGGATASNTGTNAAASIRALSDDGRWLVFSSNATDAVASQGGSAATSLFLFDVQAGTTRLLNRAFGGATTTANGATSGAVGLSNDGRYVAFLSAGTNLVSGQTGGTDVQLYLYNRVADTIALASHAAAGVAVGGNTAATAITTTVGIPIMSADGRYVAFASTASDLVAGYSGTGQQYYLYDRLGNSGAGSVTLVSHTTAGATTGTAGTVLSAALSPNGSRFVFSAIASDFMTGITYGPVATIHAYNTVTGAFTFVSGTAVDGRASSSLASLNPVVSPDGTQIAFSSAGSDLAALDSNTASDLFGSTQTFVAIAPEIYSAPTASATYGSAFSFQVLATSAPTGYTATGLPTGLSIDATTGAITGTPAQIGPFTVTLGATNTGGSGSGTLTLTVAKAPLTVAGATAATKVYDRLTTATLNFTGANLSGVVAGDSANVTLDTSGGAGAFADKLVGTAKPVTVTGLVVTGPSAGNYAFTQPVGLTADITTASLTVSGVTASARTYDATTAAPLNATSASLVGVIGGDTVALSTGGIAGTFALKTVGTAKPITVTGLTISGADAANYAVTQPTGLAADVTAKNLTVAGVTASARIYDATTAAPLTATSASLVGVIGGDTVAISTTGIAGAFALKTVGTAKPITVTGVTISGADAANYTLTQPTGLTADVTVKTLTVAGVTASARVYDATSAAPLNASSASLVGVIGGDTVTLSTAGIAGAFAGKTVGTAKPITVTGITISGADAANYALTQPAGLAADVTARSLTVTGVTASARIYDATTAAPLNATSASLVGVIGGDTVAISTAGMTGTFALKTIGTAKPVTVAGITATGADAANYTVTQPTGLTANVTAKNLTVSGVTAASKVYDGNTAASLGFGSAAIVGLAGSDSVTLVTGGATGAFVNASVGFNKSVQVSGLALAGSDAGNYTLTQPTAFASITSTSVSIAITNLNQTYDGTPKSATITVSPAVATTIVYSTPGGVPPTNAGSYTVSVVVTDPNYSGTATASLVIGKANQVVNFTITGANFNVGTPLNLNATATSGLPVTFSVISGSAALSGATATVTTAGLTIVRASQAGDNNYASASADQSFTGVAKTAQTISFTPPSNHTAGDFPFALNATASSGLPVTFTVVSGPAFLTGGTVTLVGSPGLVTLRASQAGNATFSAAPDVTASFLVSAPGVEIFFGDLFDDSGTNSNRGELFLTAGPSLDAKTGDVAAVIFPGSNHGILLVVAPTLGLNIPLDFTLNADGTYLVSFTSGGRSLTVNGSLTSTTLVGHIPALHVSFSLSAQSLTGPTATIAGSYQGTALNTATGTISTIVGPNGQILVVAQTGPLSTGALGTISGNGAFTVAVPGASVTGVVDAGTTIISGTISVPGQPNLVFSGLSAATSRTDRLINLSSRVLVGPSASRTLITGFVIGGTESKRVLLRAVGPTLSSFGVHGPLSNPRLQLYDAAGRLILENDDWTGADTSDATTRVGAFTLSANSKDAALLTTLAPGAYTMQVIDSGETGVALAEIYDASANPNSEYQRLVNISTRGEAGAGENVLIGGFIVTGNSPKKVLVRGIGPGLAAFGLPGALADPRLRVYNATGLVAENDNWSADPASAALVSDAARATGAFTLANGSKDAAMILTLAPGAYTAQVGATDGTATGTALVEIYEIP